eukprot:scaffold135307_cov69-Phaeocystis_antarctica.AAC.2
MAVENDWGGQSTRDKALSLLERTLQALNTPVVHRDEVEAFLEDTLVEDFNIEAEDESPKQVAEVLCKLHAEALAGITTTAALLAERAAAKGKSWVDAPLPPGRHRAGDSSDDESDDGEDDMDMEGGGGGGEGSARQYQAPEIDDDGFQTVRNYRCSVAVLPFFSTEPTRGRAPSTGRAPLSCPWRRGVKLKVYGIRDSAQRRKISNTAALPYNRSYYGRIVTSKTSQTPISNPHHGPTLRAAALARRLGGGASGAPPASLAAAIAPRASPPHAPNPAPPVEQP